MGFLKDIIADARSPNADSTPPAGAALGPAPAARGELAWTAFDGGAFDQAPAEGAATHQTTDAVFVDRSDPGVFAAAPAGGDDVRSDSPRGSPDGFEQDRITPGVASSQPIDGTSPLATTIGEEHVNIAVDASGKDASVDQYSSEQDFVAPTQGASGVAEGGMPESEPSAPDARVESEPDAKRGPDALSDSSSVRVTEAVERPAAPGDPRDDIDLLPPAEATASSEKPAASRSDRRGPVVPGQSSPTGPNGPGPQLPSVTGVVPREPGDASQTIDAASGFTPGARRTHGLEPIRESAASRGSVDPGVVAEAARSASGSTADARRSVTPEQHPTAYKAPSPKPDGQQSVAPPRSRKTGSLGVIEKPEVAPDPTDAMGVRSDSNHLGPKRPDVAWANSRAAPDQPAQRSPDVHIGQIDVIVEAPKTMPKAATAPADPVGSLTSRHYLRRLG